MHEQNFSNQDQLMKHAESLLKNSDYKELEKLFAKYLKKSYDVRFWNMYINYVKNISSKRAKLVDVYSFVVKHFECSYFSYNFVRDYINEVNLLDEDGNSVDLIRKIYTSSIFPMQNLGLLWSDYEKWEAKTNKLTAKANIELVQPQYQLCSSAYQRLLPHIESNSFFRIFDIELENPLKLSKKDLESRLNFLFKFYLNKFPESEQLLFLYSFYLKDHAVERANSRTDNTFLSIWFSFLYNKIYFNFEDQKNSDLVQINYLNWKCKNEGIESFRQHFSEIKGSVGPHVYIYAANAEFYQGTNKEGCYQIFIEAVERFKDTSLVNDSFFDMFLKIGDDSNIRLLFKKLKKTERMWDSMIKYEFLHGEMQDYSSLLVEKQKEIHQNLLLPPSVPVLNKIKSKGSQGIFESTVESFGFLDLQLSIGDLLTGFINMLPKLPREENIFLNVDKKAVIDMLVSINL